MKLGVNVLDVNFDTFKHKFTKCFKNQVQMEDMGTIECKTPSNRGDNILVSATAFDVTKVRIQINFIIIGRGSW